MIQHALYVIASTRLRVGRNIPRYVGWRPAPRVEHDAAVAPSEIANLQLPTAIVASELVNEDDRSSAASFLVVELHIVVGGEEWHGLVSSLVVLRRSLPRHSHFCSPATYGVRRVPPHGLRVSRPALSTRCRSTSDRGRQCAYWRDRCAVFRRSA